MDLKEMEGWEGDLGAHWYYASKAAALDRILRPVRFRSIADIGAGSGFFAKHLLERRSEARRAVCVDVNYERDTEQWLLDKRVIYRRQAPTGGADLYLLMDVLEHVEDDVGLLRSVVDGAPDSAHFVMSVPAFPFLWSGHDEYLGHYRRYTLAQIVEVSKRAGLEIKKCCYFFGAIFPAVAAMRLSRRWLARSVPPKSDMGRMPVTLNRVLRTVCWLEESAFTMNRMFGLTAFVLATRAREAA
jgi:SAM-dependent methyltransferase